MNKEYECDCNLLLQDPIGLALPRIKSDRTCMNIDIHAGIHDLLNGIFVSARGLAAACQAEGREFNSHH